MPSKAALLALLALWGVGTMGAVPAFAEEAMPEDELTDRVWVEEGNENALPGSARIFLSDGTLVQDSCWETYRLSSWTRTGENAVTWNEDGIEIKADIVSLNAEGLVLSVAGIGEQRFVPAAVPYVCPDMPKD